jgi:hypothetical protein
MVSKSGVNSAGRASVRRSSPWNSVTGVEILLRQRVRASSSVIWPTTTLPMVSPVGGARSGDNL